MKIVVKAILFAFYGALIAVALLTTFGAVIGLIYGNPWKPSDQFPDWEGIFVVAIMLLYYLGPDAAFFGAVSGFVFGAFMAFQGLGTNRRSPLNHKSNVPDSLKHAIKDVDYVDRRANKQRPWQD